MKSGGHRMKNYRGKFMDRNAGNGTSWYYSVAVVDINGQRKFSDFIAGWSKP